MSGEIIRYEAMVYAIAECHAIDEVKDTRRGHEFHPGRAQRCAELF
jgi:hypothetical protein